MAFGREVTVQIKTMDRYGRIVGEVILPDGLSLNKQLIYIARLEENFTPIPYQGFNNISLRFSMELAYPYSVIHRLRHQARAPTIWIFWESQSLYPTP